MDIRLLLSKPPKSIDARGIEVSQSHEPSAWKLVTMICGILSLCSGAIWYTAKVDARVDRTSEIVTELRLRQEQSETNYRLDVQNFHLDVSMLSKEINQLKISLAELSVLLKEQQKIQRREK